VDKEGGEETGNGREGAYFCRMRFHFLRCHVSEVMRFKDRPDGMVARSPPACTAHEGMCRVSHSQ
jgi:hypothetical protein